MNEAMRVEDHWIESGRGKLFARCWTPAEQDEKPPIVLLHDSLGCVQLWRTFPAALAEQTRRRVIAYDRLGFGQSDRREDVLSANFIREEAETFFPRVREQLGINRFVVFGHSVGGGMAVHCAALYAEDCEALISESAQSLVEPQTRGGVVQAKEFFRHPEAFERLQRYHGEKARWVLDAWTETWLSPAFEHWSLDDVLPQVRCRTLVIHGSEDEFGSRAHPERIAERVSGPAEMEFLEGVGHVPHREREAWVAERVARFLAP